MTRLNPAYEKQVREIGAELSGWIVRDASGTPTEWHDWRLRHEDGRELSFDWPTYPKPGRLIIHGQWPKANDGQMRMPRNNGHNSSFWTPSITVSSTKAPRIIARDIERRLLAEYTPAFQEAMQLVKDANSYADQTKATVAALLAVEPKAHQAHHADDRVFLGSDSHAYSLNVSGDSVRFEAFSVPLSVAKQLLPLLRKPQSASEEE